MRVCIYISQATVFSLFFVVVISLFLIGGESLYSIVLVSAIHQHVKRPFCLQPHPTSPSSPRALSWVPWVIEQIPISCLFPVWKRVCFSATLSSSHALLPCVHKSVLYVCVSIVALQKFVCIIFLDSMYIYISVIFVFLFLTYFIHPTLGLRDHKVFLGDLRGEACEPLVWGRKLFREPTGNGWAGREFL